MDLFFSAALADTATSGGFDFMGLLPLVLVFVVMYFLLIRPQQKKAQELKQMQQNLQRGDRVLMNGGLYGEVVKVSGPDEVSLEIAEGVKVKVAPQMIGSIVPLSSPTQPKTVDNTPKIGFPELSKEKKTTPKKASTPTKTTTPKATKPAKKATAAKKTSSIKKVSGTKKTQTSKKSTGAKAKKVTSTKKATETKKTSSKNAKKGTKAA